ncbi:tRNA ligase, partial [Cymbomonas tetramitiformis]
ETLTERRKLLYESLKETEGEMMFAIERTSRDVEELGMFLTESINAGTEGLIVKALDTTYEPSKRSLNWLKLKKDYMDGVGDSLDLVVIGGYRGKGKRAGVYGAFLMACYNDENEEYQTICKIGTGFSEENLELFASQLKELEIDQPRPYYSYGEGPNVMPDVWFEAKAVWEVKAADLSISPVHKAALGQVDDGKGIALRFPRFLRVRDDKKPDMATNATQVTEMYNAQSLIQ